MRVVGRICPHCRQFVEGGERHGCMSPDQKLRRDVYDDPRWKVTRLNVLTRDGFQCVLCDTTGGPFVADHSPVPLIALLRLGRDPFDPAACRTLCLPCSGSSDGPRASSA